jgi:hypothetical protein
MHDWDDWDRPLTTGETLASLLAVLVALVCAVVAYLTL